MREPPEVRRALLVLLSAVPHLHGRYNDFIRQHLPDRFERAWSLVNQQPSSWEESDEVSPFEEWGYSGAESSRRES